MLVAELGAAPRRDLAEKFINYLLDGKIGAQLSSYTQFASPNKAALPFLPDAVRGNPVIYPPADLRAKLEFLQDLGGKNRLYEEIWTQVKAK